MGRSGQPNGVNRIRRNIENYRDPYISQQCPEETTVCTVCGAIYTEKRWYLKEQVDPEKLRNQPVHFTTCPACRKIHDRNPGGVVHITGRFAKTHSDDILSLIRNENDRAMMVNPLERIIDIETNESGYKVLTTNERLAQRIGKALHMAYSGNIDYKWSEDNKLVRVYWNRE
jgi:NMD protein affecting ribosome stability and mRNA decay